MKILCYGSLNLDHTYQVPHFVEPGETLSAKALQINCGGKGLNQSIALARAGGEVWHAGAIGADGAPLRGALEANGVNTEFLLTLPEVPTGHAIIEVDPSGQNRILLFGGANRCIPEAPIDRVLAQFGRGDYLVLQNEVNGNAYIMEQAHHKGMTIVLNPSPMDPAVGKLPLEYVDWFMVNEVEMGSLCGGNADAFLNRYPQAGVVLTLGSRGVVCFYQGKRFAHGIYQVPVVDTTAAGDTFSGYFIARIAAGEDIPTALRTASLASSIAVSRAGAQSSIPSQEEVLRHQAPYVPFAGDEEAL